MRTAHRQALTRARQQGAALLVMLILLITGGAYLLVSQLNRASGRIEADRKTSEALAKAKEVLIAWAVGYGAATGNTTTPGMLPYPDRRNDGQYDGWSDCPLVVAAPSAALLLGKIPQVGLKSPCSIPWTPLNLDVVDGAGEVLWYAVSRNLVSALGVAPVINPGIMDNPPFPWLVVRDQSGTILNNRVAFVLIAPGPPLPGQDRTVPPPPALPPTPAQFLESIGLVSNADFDGTYDSPAPCVPNTAPPMCEDFVMSEPWPSATSPTFNDRVLYVTIDELMPLIEKRVAREVRVALRNMPGLPAPAALGYLGSDCAGGDGFLPLRSCECRRTGNDINCDCPFDTPPTASITYTYTGSASFTARLNGCVLTPSAACRCNGAGECSSATQTFRCTADGACAAHNMVVPGTFSVDYRLPTAAVAAFTTATASCSVGPPIPAATVSCSNFAAAAGVVGGIAGVCLPAQMLTGLPDWFLNSGWKHYMYYATGTLTVGVTAGVNAVVISGGRPLIIGVPQTRPSLSRIDYLDDAQNRDGPNVFTGPGQPLTNIFNDQAVIVSP